jgi:DtxR family Mn-dependent transcriptional regulator
MQEHTVARTKDIAERLGVGTSSVSGAMQMLRERGLVNHEPYGYVTLTPNGRVIAERVVRRHNAWKQFLTEVLGIGHSEAEDTACRLEHGVSTHVTDRLIAFVGAFTDELYQDHLSST